LNETKSPADNKASAVFGAEVDKIEKGKQAKKTPTVSPIKIPIDPSRMHSGVTSEVTDVQIDNIKTSKPLSVNHESNDHGSTLGKTTMSPNTADGTQRAVIITRSINNTLPANVKVSTQGSIGQFEDITKEMKNFEAFSHEYADKPVSPQVIEEYMAVVEGSPSKMYERMSGYPNPKLYDQFYIN